MLGKPMQWGLIWLLERIPEKWIRFSEKNTRKNKRLELGA